MSLSPEEQRLRDQFFTTLLETAVRLQTGPDPEVTLEALIDASQLLQDHLPRELEALRGEQAECPAPSREGVGLAPLGFVARLLFGPGPPLRLRVQPFGDAE